MSVRQHIVRGHSIIRRETMKGIGKHFGVDVQTKLLEQGWFGEA